MLTDEPGAWWVTCFAIESHHRRSGVGSALLEGAVTFARDQGATAVEGYPVDVTALTAARVSGSALYTGTMAMFLAAGFSEVARTFPTRPVMRLPTSLSARATKRRPTLAITARPVATSRTVFGDGTPHGKPPGGRRQPGDGRPA